MAETLYCTDVRANTTSLGNPCMPVCLAPAEDATQILLTWHMVNNFQGYDMRTMTQEHARLLETLDALQEPITWHMIEEATGKVHTFDGMIEACTFAWDSMSDDVIPWYKVMLHIRLTDPPAPGVPKHRYVAQVPLPG
jgi:hypothetical protein